MQTQGWDGERLIVVVGVDVTPHFNVLKVSVEIGDVEIDVCSEKYLRRHIEVEIVAGLKKTNFSE